MNKQRIDFKIYPSLLDKFQEFLDYQIAAEEPWNKVSESAKEKGQYPDAEVGDYILTPDEMADKLEQELIDTINRVPHEPWEAADRCTCFNEVVDMLLADRECDHEGMEGEMGDDTITARYEGFTFTYDRAFCEEVAQGLAGSVSQLFTKATIDTKCGTVELYGFIDEYRLNQVIDLKTTSQYDFLKFERKWQRHIYPYCLVESGHEVEGFEYRVIKWKGGTKYQPALSGEVIPEYYTYIHSESTDALRAMLEQFIGWLESRKDRITDTKIFASDEKPATITVADDIDSDFIIAENFRYLPSNLGRYESMEEAMQTLAKAGIFATAEGTGATRALSDEELQELRTSITDIVENERIDAANEVAAALAFEERMKAEIKRRKEQAQAALDEIDDRIMEKAKMIKDNRKSVSLAGTDTIRVSVSDKNLYYHLEDGALVLAYVGYASNDDMSGLFFQAEVNEASMKTLFGIDNFKKEKTCEVLKIAEMVDEELIGRQIIADPERTVFEDFLDEDSGTVHTAKRTERCGIKKLPAKITDKLLEKLKDGGFQTILVAKEDSEKVDEHSDQ
jgi:hypothetical protein